MAFCSYRVGTVSGLRGIYHPVQKSVKDWAVFKPLVDNDGCHGSKQYHLMGVINDKTIPKPPQQGGINHSHMDYLFLFHPHSPILDDQNRKISTKLPRAIQIWTIWRWNWGLLALLELDFLAQALYGSSPGQSEKWTKQRGHFSVIIRNHYNIMSL